MRFFDVHLHLPSPDAAGVDAFLQFVENEPDLLGGNLILNTPEEVAITEANLDRLPSNIVLIPYFQAGVRHSEPLLRSGWYKLHPTLQRLDANAIPDLVSALKLERPKGVMVHCFPWGPDLHFNISLRLVIELARNLPDVLILATHGGGYESWAFRAHAGGFKNVHFDFSMTLDYYQGADAVQPLQRYLRFSRSRVHFGSDWPSGHVGRQLEEFLRLAKNAGLQESELETQLLNNARTGWAGAFELKQG
jgi:predicted TIM-barrel fold metal-dependent hydrolase